MIFVLETKRLGCNSKITLDEVIESVVDLILCPKSNKNLVRYFDNIRTNIYDILITNIKGSDIITTILDMLIDKISDDMILCKIIQHASVAEYNLIHGRRDIKHIDYFIIGVMKELQIYSEKPKYIITSSKKPKIIKSSTKSNGSKTINVKKLKK